VKRRQEKMRDKMKENFMNGSFSFVTSNSEVNIGMPSLLT
jgi:hypothetical protein